MRILRRRRRRRRQEERRRRDPSYNIELDLVQAFKDEDYIRCAVLLRKFDTEGLESSFIESLKPKVLEKIQNENLDII